MFNSGCFCRFCLISYDQFRDNIHIENIILRNEHNYNNHINYLQSDDTTLSFGIRNKCQFSKLSYFKPYENVPPDLMHDLIEGVIPLTMYKVLQYLKADNLISIDSMNNKLSLIDFPINKNILLLFEDNIFAKRNHLKGTASQHLALFYNLPRIVDITKLKNNKYWEIYLILREIFDYLYSPKIAKDILIHISDLVESYLIKFSNCFDKYSLIPKHHFMLHYSHYISLYGPPRYSYCMPFEAKHQYFKNIQKTTKNFKNITHTLSKRHQFNIANIIINENFMSNLIINNVREIIKSNLPLALITSIEYKCNINIPDIVNISKSITMNYINYIVDPLICYVLELNSDNNHPIFFHNKYIININLKWYLCGKLSIPVYYNYEAHAYKVTLFDDWFILEPDKLYYVYKHRFYSEQNNNFAYTIFNI